MNFKKRVKEAALVLGMSAMLAGCKTNNAPKETKAVVTEAPDEKEEKSTLESFEEKGFTFQKSTLNEDYYEITTSMVGDISINDYFNEKNIVPRYTAKLNPYDFAEILNNKNLINKTYYKVIAENKNLNSNQKELINKLLSDGRFYEMPYFEIVQYNLSKLSIKEVKDNEEYYCKFDPINCCIYINTKYADEYKEYVFALNLAIKGYLRFNAYMENNGAKLYCSLTNFYYDAKNNKLLELGKSLSEDRAYNCLEMYDRKTYIMEIPTAIAELMYSHELVANCLQTSFSPSAQVRDYGYFTYGIMEGNKELFPEESEKFALADLLIRADRGDKEALKRIIDYSKITNGNANNSVANIMPWIKNLDSLRSKMMDYASNDYNDLFLSQKTHLR